MGAFWPHPVDSYIADDGCYLPPRNGIHLTSVDAAVSVPPASSIGDNRVKICPLSRRHLVAWALGRGFRNRGIAGTHRALSSIARRASWRMISIISAARNTTFSGSVVRTCTAISSGLRPAMCSFMIRVSNAWDARSRSRPWARAALHFRRQRPPRVFSAQRRLVPLLNLISEERHQQFSALRQSAAGRSKTRRARPARAPN